MSIQHVNTMWIYLESGTQIWHGKLSATQGVFQPIHWATQARMEAELRLAPTEGQVADIGCGHGIVAVNLAWKRPRTTVIGIDPDEQCLTVGRHLLQEHSIHNCSFRCATLEQPGIDPGSCTGVICGQTLDHIPDVRPVLKDKVDQLMGLLRRGGRLIISILDPDVLSETSVQLPPSLLRLQDFDFLTDKVLDPNCPRWWYLFYVHKR